jgi:hypothetical protein
VPYEGRKYIISNINGVNYIFDQKYRVKLFKEVDGKYIETDDCERWCRFFEPMGFDKNLPEQLYYGVWGPNTYPFLPDGSPQKIKALEIGIRIVGNPYSIRDTIFGQEADLVYVDAFFPNGRGGFGGKVKVLVDVVPVGENTRVYLNTQLENEPLESDFGGSAYGTLW